MLQGSTQAKPLHWTVFVKQFVEEGEYSNDELVSAMNSILLPFGKMHGANHNFWIEN